MSVRQNYFPLYLLPCLAPLLLLAVLSYWNAIRTVDVIASKEAQNNLNALTGEVNRRLEDEEVALTRLALTPALQQLVSGNPAPQLVSGHKDTNQDPGSDQKRSAQSLDLPDQLKLSLASLLGQNGQYARLGLYAQNRQPLFQMERQESGLIMRKSDPAPHPLPSSPLSKPVVPVLYGSILQYSVPVSSEGATSEPAMLVGELNLDEIFAETASVLETQNRHNEPPDSAVIVLDASEHIIYHSDHALQGKVVSSEIPAFLPIADAMVANKSGIQKYQPSGGPEYLTAFSPLPRLNIAIAVSRNRSQLVSGARRDAFSIFAVAIVLGLVAAALLGRHVQKRSRGIELVTEELTAIAKGELDRRIELKSSDDARGIADNINLVTERLRAQIAREAESRQFQSFVRLSAMLTHDLKNAIEVLSLTVGNMERHYDNQQFRADAMRSLAGATDKLKAIVSRLTKPLTSLSGEHKPPFNVDLVPILKRVVEITAGPLRENYTIKMKLPPTLFALVDAGRIEEVIENLVLNALEAMGQQSGTLTVEAESLPSGAAMFAISDTGPGMSRTFIDNRLFRPFSTTKKNGIGLGLYACREVIQASAGSIEVQSVEGAGTTFRVVLPSISHDGRN